MSKLVLDASEYQRMEAIGRGRSGTVYKMRHRVNGHEVAAKMFDFHENNEEQTKQILREIECLMELNHPNIIKILGFNFRSSDHPAAIYMPYMKNGSLANYIYSDKLSMENIAIFIEKLADAIRYLHDHDIIHRDLKPENILIDDNFRPVICDFGLSKFDDPNFTQTNGIGTPMWMAPELYEDTEYTKAVDVFSFGLICYCILSRHLPFNAKNPLYIQKIILGEVPDLSSLKKFYQRMIKGCLAKKPDQRMNFEQVYQMVNKRNCIHPYEISIDFFFTKYQLKVTPDMLIEKVMKKAIKVIRNNKYTNIRALKEIEEIKCNGPYSGFTLFYCGNTLDNERKLSDYKIGLHSTITMAIYMLG